MLLADDLVEGLRAVAAIEGRLAGHFGRVYWRAKRPPGGVRALCETGDVSSEDILDHGRRIAELERKVSALYQRIGQAEAGHGFGFDAAEPASVSAAADPRLAELVASGKKIDAIKLYRELTGAGLAEAKDAIDRM